LVEWLGPRLGIAVLGPPSVVGVGGTTLEVMRGTVWPVIAGGKLGRVMENLVLCAGALMMDVGIWSLLDSRGLIKMSAGLGFIPNRLARRRPKPSGWRAREISWSGVWVGEEGSGWAWGGA